MRGEERRQRSMLLVVNLEERIPKEHPLTRIKQMADLALRELSPIFDEIYSVLGRPSIPPERLLKASLLMALYTIRSERLFCEQLDYNLLFRWFLDMELDEPSFDHSSFGANRKRLLEREVAGQFFRQTVAQAHALGLLSHEHFTVDGTLIEAWASLKSFKPNSSSTHSVAGRSPLPWDSPYSAVCGSLEKQSGVASLRPCDPSSRSCSPTAHREAAWTRPR